MLFVAPHQSLRPCCTWNDDKIFLQRTTSATKAWARFSYLHGGASQEGDAVTRLAGGGESGVHIRSAKKKKDQSLPEPPGAPKHNASDKTDYGLEQNAFGCVQDHRSSRQVKEWVLSRPYCYSTTVWSHLYSAMCSSSSYNRVKSCSSDWWGLTETLVWRPLYKGRAILFSSHSFQFPWKYHWDQTATRSREPLRA